MYCHACSCAKWPCDGMFCGGFDFPPKFIDSYEICRYACSCAQRPLLRYICGVFCFRAAFPRTHDAMCAHMTQYAHTWRNVRTWNIPPCVLLRPMTLLWIFFWEPYFLPKYSFSCMKYATVRVDMPNDLTTVSFFWRAPFSRENCPIFAHEICRHTCCFAKRPC